MATARLYQRQGAYWIDLRQEGRPRRRKSLGTSGRREAEARRWEEEARLVLQGADMNMVVMLFDNNCYGLTDEIQEAMLRMAGAELASREFELCRGKVEMGIELQPVRFLDPNDVEAILKSYMYGLAGML